MDGDAFFWIRSLDSYIPALSHPERGPLLRAALADFSERHRTRDREYDGLIDRAYGFRLCRAIFDRDAAHAFGYARTTPDAGRGGDGPRPGGGGERGG